MSTMVISAGPTRVRRATTTTTAPTAPTAPSLRLTRRGRLVVTLILTALVLVAFLASGGASVATRQPGDPAPMRTIEVQRGDSLWAIAAEVAEPGEIREMVYTIEKLNSLPDATLTEGQLLAVPVGSAG